MAGANILIVDDLPNNLRVLNDILTAEGYHVRASISGKLALQAAENNPPDLIMLDITMPELNGFEVCRLLKKKEALCDIPVIFISALSEISDKVEAFNAGGVDYVTKPFDTHEVLARVKTHCMLRQTQRELEEKNLALEDTLQKLREAQVQLVHSEKMASLGILTAGLAHEINNPVNFINSGVKGLIQIQDEVIKLMDGLDQIDWAHASQAASSVETLKKEVEYEEIRPAMQELTNSILNGATRTAEIIAGLRIFSRSDSMPKELDDLKKNVESAITLLNHRVKNEHISIHAELGEPISILCHPSQLSQVFINLFSNAIDAAKEKYPTEGGAITATMHRQEMEGNAGVLIRISDNGKGISPEVRTHIFDPFFTTKPTGSGVGLGLSISYSIIKDHNGSLSIANQEEPGTTFEVWLPTPSMNSNGGNHHD